MLHIGVSGHRFLTETEKLTQALQMGFAHLQQAFPGQAWTLLSSLAEGADCLCVEVGLERPEGRLVVVLPMPLERYLKAFSSDAARQRTLRLLARAGQVVHLPGGDDAPAAYRAAGEYLAANSDVLVAVWDGLPAQGPGGVGEVVQAVRHKGLPLVWVQAGNRLPGSNRPTSLGERQGQVIYERFPAAYATSTGEES